MCIDESGVLKKRIIDNHRAQSSDWEKVPTVADEAGPVKFVKVLSNEHSVIALDEIGMCFYVCFKVEACNNFCDRKHSSPTFTYGKHAVEICWHCLWKRTFYDPHQWWKCLLLGIRKVSENINPFFYPQVINHSFLSFYKPGPARSWQRRVKWISTRNWDARWNKDCSNCCWRVA